MGDALFGFLDLNQCGEAVGDREGFGELFVISLLYFALSRGMGVTKAKKHIGEEYSLIGLG